MSCYPLSWDMRDRAHTSSILINDAYCVQIRKPLRRSRPAKSGVTAAYRLRLVTDGAGKSLAGNGEASYSSSARGEEPSRLSSIASAMRSRPIVVCGRASLERTDTSEP